MPKSAAPTQDSALLRALSEGDEAQALELIGKKERLWAYAPDLSEAPLHRATRLGRVKEALAIIDASHDISLSFRNRMGMSAAHLALEHGQDDIFLALAARGGSVLEARNDQGETAAEMAQRLGRLDLEQAARDSLLGKPSKLSNPFVDGAKAASSSAAQEFFAPLLGASRFAPKPAAKKSKKRAP